MKNILFYARLIKYISYVLMAATLVSFFIKWFFPGVLLDNPYHIFNLSLAYTLDDYVGVASAMPTMPLIHRLLGMLIDSGVLFLWLMILWNVVAIMKKFERNELFSTSMVTLFAAMSKYSFYLALYVPINRMLLSVIITLHNAPGHRILTASFGTADLFNILMFGIFAVMTLLMQHATVLQNEQNLTV